MATRWLYSAQSGPSTSVALIAVRHWPITPAKACMPLRRRIVAVVFGDPGCDLAAGGEAEFDQYVRDVVLGCSLGDDQRFSDGLVAQTLREQASDFLLARGQRARAGGVGLSRSR